MNEIVKADIARAKSTIELEKLVNERLEPHINNITKGVNKTIFSGGFQFRYYVAKDNYVSKALVETIQNKLKELDYSVVVNFWKGQRGCGRETCDQYEIIVSW